MLEEEAPSHGDSQPEAIQNEMERIMNPAGRPATLLVEVKWIQCLVTATPGPSFKDTIWVVIRASFEDEVNATIGEISVTPIRWEHGVSPDKFKTGHWSKKVISHSAFDRTGDRPILLSVMLVNNGAGMSPAELMQVITVLDRTGINTFRRPDDKGHALVATSCIALGGASAAAAVGGPPGIVVGAIGAGAAKLVKAALKNHDGVVQYDRRVLLVRNLPRAVSPWGHEIAKDQWESFTADNRFNDARALYKLQYSCASDWV